MPNPSGSADSCASVKRSNPQEELQFAAVPKFLLYYASVSLCAGKSTEDVLKKHSSSNLMSIDRGMDKGDAIIYTYKMDYYSIIKKNEVMLFAATRMKLEVFIISGRESTIS